MMHDSDNNLESCRGLCSVVIPAYNEEVSLETFLTEVIAFCEQMDWPLIIVNDGSTDRTGQVIDSHSSPLLTQITHKLNRGYGGALKSGIEAAETEYVVTMDSDGQHRLEDLLSMLDELLRVDADMVVGSRRDAAHKGSLYRRTGKALIRGIAGMLMHVPIYDLNSGLKMYRTQLAKNFIKLCPNSMAFSDIITLIFINERCRVVELPIEIAPRLGGTSTISMQTATETMLEILNIVVLFNPMRVFLPMALLLGVFGFAWGVPFVLRGEGVQTGALLGMISGLLFFLLGLLAEQLTLIRRNLIK
jgi:glycosyltransferase involved in cell wall biosynthesis